MEFKQTLKNMYIKDNKKSPMSFDTGLKNKRGCFIYVDNGVIIYQLSIIYQSFLNIV